MAEVLVQSKLKDMIMAGAASIMSWVVEVHHAKLVDVEYTYQGQLVKYKKFTCVLSGKEPSDYCYAEAKDTKRDSTISSNHYKNYVNGSRWTLTRPRFADSKPQYVSSALKVVVNLPQSNLVKVAKPADDPLWLPIPAATVAEVARLSASSAFDIKGVITEKTEERQVTLSDGNIRSVFDIVLEDGSKHGSQQAAMKVSIWVEKNTPKDLLQSGSIVALFGLSGKRAEQGFNVNSSRNPVVQEVSAAVLLCSVAEVQNTTNEKFQQELCGCPGL